MEPEQTPRRGVKIVSSGPLLIADFSPRGRGAARQAAALFKCSFLCARLRTAYSLRCGNT